MSSTPLRPVPTADTRAAVRDAVQLVDSSRRAIPAASDRRAAAVAAARHGIEAALATERAEQDAARSALQAGLQRLTAAGLDRSQIAALCGDVPPRQGDPAGRAQEEEGDFSTGAQMFVGCRGPLPPAAHSRMRSGRCSNPAHPLRRLSMNHRNRARMTTMTREIDERDA